MADPTYAPKVYRADGGNKQVIASGGTLLLESGAILDMSALKQGIGFIPLPLDRWRLIATNDIPAIAVASGNGGNLGSDTAPKLARVNGATDKKLRIQWAASGVVAITQDVVYPPDLDDASDVVLHLLASMGGANDTPTIGVAYFEGLGDTNAGGNTGAVTGTGIAEYTRTIVAADVGAAPNAATIELTPAAHGTDVLNLYAAWLTYIKKTT